MVASPEQIHHAVSFHPVHKQRRASANDAEYSFKLPLKIVVLANPDIDGTLPRLLWEGFQSRAV